ncbi:MAG TPA: putative DNA-binding domain-containing protein [Methylobacter sp.]|jgi:uncharacterized membrane protein YphA (DoxX/SURF4 family)
MMAFQYMQRQFLAHLRNPEQQPLPTGFDQPGVALYTDLLYNKFNDSLEMCFPVTHAILGENNWQRLINDFIAQHRCLSPYYRQIPDEFIEYLQNKHRNDTTPPYLLELAHFEWVEMALAIVKEEQITTDSELITDWLACRPVFAPVFQLLNYAYPVQRINENYQPTTPPEQATHILGFRDENDAVQFIELNPATARLLEILHGTDYTVGEAMQQIARELQQPEPSVLFAFGIEALTELMQHGAILGARKNSEKTIMDKTHKLTECNVCPVHVATRELCKASNIISRWFAENMVGFAPLTLRLLIAYEFLDAGLEKLSGENWFADLAFPFPFNLLPPDVSWELSIGLEIIAPIALILGLATRFFSFSLMILTMVAIAAVHWPAEWHTLAQLWQGYAITDQGYGNYKLPLMYLFMLASLLFSGSGRLSLDAWLANQKTKNG